MISAEELNWIKGRMKTYEIKYGEIYNEILDHIISAIETKRTDGSNANMAILFQQVVDGQFGGHEGIANLAISKEDAYNQNIQNLWWQSLRYHLTWPMLAFTIVVLLLSLRLPNTEPVKLSILMGCILLTVSSAIYAHFSLKGRVLKSADNSQRFLKPHLIKKAATSFGLLNWLLCFLPGYAIAYLPPIIFMVIMLIYILLNLAAIRFCQQFKTLKPTTC
jgi:uncharacterized integral membrane protein